EAVRSAIAAMDPDAALVAITAHAAAPPDIVAAAARALADRRAVLLVEGAWPDARTAIAAMSTNPKEALGATGPDVAVYWPRVRRPGSGGSVAEVSPLGGVAGVIARTDAARGVFRAPGGSAAVLRDVIEPSETVTRADEEALTQLGVNVIRAFARIGTVVWGARTQAVDSDWKYLPVRRTFLHIAESIERGLGWVVFEPNDEPLWRRVRLSVEAFLLGLFREGAFAGAAPEDAFFVKCDRSTMTQDDLGDGRLVCVVGFAPLKPAEFVVFTLGLQTADAGR
ncbi:MAG: phage tail sheath family protein, partial [Microbacterium sp.]